MPYDAGLFWAYSLAFYRRPAVRAACLRLQDGHGQAVNLLLLVCWLATHRQSLTAEDCAQLLAATAAWRHRVLQPLRALRRQALVQPAAALREALLAAELQAERQEQALLLQALQALPPMAADSCAAAVRQGLAACWQASGRALPLPADMQALAVEAETAA